MHISFSDGALNVDFPRLSLREVRSGVEFSLVKEKSPISWFPAKAAEIFKTERQTPLGEANDMTMTWLHEEGYQVSWSICRLKEIPGLTLRASFTNLSHDSLRLKNIVMCKTAQNGLVCQGDPSTWWLLPAMEYSRQSGNLMTVLPNAKRLQEQNVYGYAALDDDDPRNVDGRWRFHEEAVTLYSDRDRRGIVMGAVGPAISYVKFNCHVDSGTVLLEIVSEMDNILVEPGETRQSEEVLMLAQPYEKALATLFSWIAETHQARKHADAVFGWLSWYDLFFHVTESHITGIAETVKRFRDRIPLQVIQIDMGWELGGDMNFSMIVDKNKFPHGLKASVENIRQAGAIPGIWMAPLFSDVKRPDSWYQDKRYKDPKECDNRLDPTHPEVEHFIQKSIVAMKDSGFSYFKFDYNYIGNFQPDNPKMTKFELMRHLFSLYRQAVGDDCFLLACGAAARPVVGLADAYRIGWDTLARWKSYPLADDGLPTLPTDIYDGIFTTALSSLMNTRLFINDPDVTYLLPRAESHIWQGAKESFDPKKHGIGWPELKSFHSYVGLLGGMAMVSEPIRQAKYQQHNALRMLEIVNPPAPDKGWSMNGDIDPWGRQFGFVAQRPWGAFASLVLWNKDDEPTDLTLDFHSLQAIGKQFHVWSFWDEQYLGIGNASFVAKDVAAHGCALLRLTPISRRKDIPLVIGSNLHICMGSAELETIQTTPNEMKIELTDAGARNGKIFIYSPIPLEVKRTSGCQAFIVAMEKNVWIVAVTNRSRAEKNVIELVKGTQTHSAEDILKNPDAAKLFSTTGFDFAEMRDN